MANSPVAGDGQFRISDVFVVAIARVFARVLAVAFEAVWNLVTARLCWVAGVNVEGGATTAGFAEENTCCIVERSVGSSEATSGSIERASNTVDLTRKFLKNCE